MPRAMQEKENAYGSVEQTTVSIFILHKFAGGGDKMQVKVSKPYFDKDKHRNIGAGETIEVSEKRVEELRCAGVLTDAEQKKVPEKKG